MRTGSSPVFRMKHLLYGCYTKSYKLIRGSVGTGRRARLRILCILLAYGFKSRLPHKELWKQSSFFVRSVLSLSRIYHFSKDKLVVSFFLSALFYHLIDICTKSCYQYPLRDCRKDFHRYLLSIFLYFLQKRERSYSSPSALSVFTFSAFFLFIRAKISAPPTITIEIHCEVDNAPNPPLSSERRNSIKNLPTP